MSVLSSLDQKPGRHWPHSVPGDLIDGYFGDEGIKTRMAYKQVIEGIDFFIHHQKDDGYVTKIVSTHGTVNKVQCHTTFQIVRGEQKTFDYAEPKTE